MPHDGKPESRALIGFGQVRHRRLKPVLHAFVYGSYFLLLPLRSLEKNGPGALALNRRAALSFFDADHGDGRGPEQGGALAWLDGLLQAQGILDATGEVHVELDVARRVEVLDGADGYFRATGGWVGRIVRGERRARVGNRRVARGERAVRLVAVAFEPGVRGRGCHGCQKP